MSATLFGLVYLLIFAVSQAVRDVFFGNVFQSVSFFVVAMLAFGCSTVVFGALAMWRRPMEVRALIGHTGLYFALNATTALAWVGYFFALKNIEPAIVNTLYTGIGPIAVLGLSVCGISMAKGAVTDRAERLAHCCVLASLIAIASVAIVGQSGLAEQAISVRVVAVLAALTGGVLITVSHMIARRFGDLGIGSDALMGFRFPLALALVMVAEFALGQPQMRPDAEALFPLAFAAFGLIVIPSFFLQLGVARTSPLVANIMRSLGPIFVFVVQQFDGRTRFSGATLFCILAFVIFATITSVLRAWAEAKAVSV